jgi:hypothetical protein
MQDQKKLFVTREERIKMIYFLLILALISMGYLIHQFISKKDAEAALDTEESKVETEVKNEVDSKL